MELPKQPFPKLNLKGGDEKTLKLSSFYIGSCCTKLMV